jgi:hypothetical protein
MSEYQFYEFQAVDRLLTRAELEVMSKISSRSTLTASAAVFVYNYKDFPADEEKILAAYYDAYLYLSAWGSRRLMFRFPAAAVDLEGMRRYAAADLVEIREQGQYVILDFCPRPDEPDGGWADGDGMLSELISLRSDILNSDYRSLYLVWLLGVDLSLHADQDLEPPIPTGLGSLGEVHHVLIKFFDISKDLVAAAATAAERSTHTPVAVPDFQTAIALLSPQEKDDFLLRLANEEAGLQHVFRKRLQSFSAPTTASSSMARRSSEELYALAEVMGERREAAKKAEQRREQQLKLDKIFKNKDALWREVYALIHRRKPKDYDSAVVILRDLKAAATDRNESTAYDQQLAQLCKEFKSLVGLIGRIKHEGLT